MHITNVVAYISFTSRPPSSIMDLSVSNSTVIIGLNNAVMRLNLMNPEEIDSKILKIN